MYAAGDLLSGRASCGYRFRNQAIRELSAYGSPVRTTAVAWITLHELLQLAFGAGVWLSADGSRALPWSSRGGAGAAGARELTGLRADGAREGRAACAGRADVPGRHPGCRER